MGEIGRIRVISLYYGLPHPPKVIVFVGADSKISIHGLRLQVYRGVGIAVGGSNTGSNDIRDKKGREAVFKAVFGRKGLIIREN